MKNVRECTGSASSILTWISTFQIGFLDFKMNFKMDFWISNGFLILIGFLNFKWMSGFQSGFLNLQRMSGWFSMSPLPRSHHHDIMAIVELFTYRQYIIYIYTYCSYVA